MKIVFILLFISFNIFASNIDNFAKEMNFQRDYNTALTKAKKENKMLVMILSADYCPWCRKFERKVLSSSLVKSRLNTEVITLVVDNKYDINLFPKKFRTRFTPLVIFINPQNESILVKSANYVKKREFLSILDNAKKIYKANK